MNNKNWLIATIVLVIILAVGCKEERDYSEPEHLLNYWANATEKLDYSKYSRIEASPSAERSFRKMYENYYISNIRITDVDPEEGVNSGKDHNETAIEYKNVHFIANTVVRNTGKPLQSVRGEVKMIRYPEGRKSDKGWMMSNRTIIRIDQ